MRVASSDGEEGKESCQAERRAREREWRCWSRVGDAGRERVRSERYDGVSLMMMARMMWMGGRKENMSGGEEGKEVIKLIGWRQAGRQRQGGGGGSRG